MDDAARVRVLERAADLDGDAHRLVDREPSVGSGGDAAGEIAGRHVLRDDVDRAALLDHVVDGDDVGMVTETRHRLRFALEAEASGRVEPGQLDARDGDLAVKPAIVTQVDALHRPFAEQSAERVATVGDRGWRRDGRRYRRVGGGRLEARAAAGAIGRVLRVLALAGRAAHEQRIVARSQSARPGEGRTIRPTMQPRLAAFLAAVIAVSIVARPAAAQRLVDGERHSIRERDVDIESYRAELQLDLERHRVDGRATITLRPLRELDVVSLDAWNLEIAEARLGAGGPRLDTESNGRTVAVRLPAPKAPGDVVTIQIAWSASPRAGLYFQKDPATGSPIVYSYGEGGLHANWLPIYNDTNDRFSTEMIVTVPRALTVISNGVLVERKEAGDLVTYDWREERPHPNYLIAIYAGDFERGALPPTKSGVPLAYWVPRGRLDEGEVVFRNTTRMVELFSRLFDYEYPWAKYDQVAVPDFPIGAMEHTTVTGHDASVLRGPAGAKLGAPLDFGPPELGEYSTDWKAEATISHELAHHWFGNDVTCAALSEIWLNESFASYLMMLWAEESEGREELLFDLDRARLHYFEYVEREASDPAAAVGAIRHSRRHLQQRAHLSQRRRGAAPAAPCPRRSTILHRAQGPISTNTRAGPSPPTTSSARSRRRPARTSTGSSPTG